MASKARKPGAPDASELPEVVLLRRLNDPDATEPEADFQADSSRAYALLEVLEAAQNERHCPLSELTVLSPQIDPYRIAKVSTVRAAEWIARQIERSYQPDQRVHIRGLHYALVAQGDVRKPDGTIYRNTDADHTWLGEAVKAARWLGFVPFERISDNRNNEPVIFRNNCGTGSPIACATAGAWWDAWQFDLGELHVNPPGPSLQDFYRAQPYSLVIFCEKSSAEGVLRPIAERKGADLYLGAGEISDTHLHRIAKDGVADGRPMAVITIADFDPAGWQMPVSIGRKLQALRDLCFPELRFDVAPIAMTAEQVREFGLPSTPLKETEKRADKWRVEFNLEQTEVDALATLRPDILRQIVEQGLAPYFDLTLESRISRAEWDWRVRAQRVIAAQVDAETVVAIERDIEDLEADATQRIEAIKAEIDERIAEANDRLKEMVEDIELPDVPALPEVVLPAGERQALLVSSEWSWTEQTRALKARKTYGSDES